MNAQSTAQRAAPSVAPAKLPRLTRGDVANWNRICTPRAPLALGEDFALHFGADRGALQGRIVRLDLSAGPDRLAMFCQPDLLQAALATLALAKPASADLTPLLLALAFDPWLTQWEALTGLPIVVDAVVPNVSAPSGPGCMLAVQAYGGSWPVLLAGPAAALDRLLASWPVAPRGLDDVLVLPATIRLGSTQLTLAQLRSLQPGDAVLFERCPHNASFGKLIVADRLRADAKWNGRNWQLTEAPGARQSGRADWLAETPVPAAPAQAADQVPVTLCFDTEAMPLALADLRKLSAGSTIGLPAPAQSPIRLLVDGRLIGTGQLITMEGRSGACIHRMFQQ